MMQDLSIRYIEIPARSDTNDAGPFRPVMKERSKSYGIFLIL